MPVAWFGFIAVIVLLTVVADAVNVFSLGVPVILAISGYATMRRFIFDLCDEVFDGGDHLVFRRGKQTQSVPLSNITNISYASNFSPNRMIVYTRTEGSLGSELAFLPAKPLNPFKNPPIVRELIDRVDRAR